MSRGAARCALLDGAQLPGLPQWVATHACTAFSLLDAQDAALMAAGPWLVSAPAGTGASLWIGAQLAAGRGVGVVHDGDPKPLRRHFRRFLTVRTPSGSPSLFRFYDPRVLLAFLPECDVGELQAFFGPVAAFQACAPLLELSFTLRREPAGELACVADRLELDGTDVSAP